MKIFKTATLLLSCLLLLTHTSIAQDTPKAQASDIIGIWEIEGTLMGDDGTGWVMPHKNSSPDCKDHSIFSEDNLGKEVTYKENCEGSEREFSWQIEGDALTLTQDSRSIKWHILSIKDNTMKVGVQLRPDSENRMYVVYKKKE